MKLSIIYHIYSDTKTLEKSLNSLFNQTNNKFELIIIDDFGSVEVKKILSKFDIKKDNISLIRLFENYGRSFCYNLGVEKAKGDYVYFAESKNIFSENFVDTIIKFSKKNYDYIGFTAKNIDSKPFDTTDVEISNQNISNFIINSTLSIRNKVLSRNFLLNHKISFVNYKNLYPIYLFEIISKSKKGIILSNELLVIENKNSKSSFYSYNLYDILEAAFMLSNKINDSNIDDELKDYFEIWLSKLCLYDFLSKMFISYSDNEKVLSIAIKKAWETLEKINATFKKNKSLNLMNDTKLKEYIKNFKPTYNYVRKNIF